MADKLSLKLEVDAKQSIQTIDSLEKELSQLKTTIKGVAVGSEEFKKMQTQIVATESKVKNLNKSIEGLDKEALAGEWGKLAGGISAGVGAIAVAAGGANQSVEQLVKTVATTMAVVQGFKGVVEAASAAQKIWNTVMKANPFILIASLVIGLITAIVALIKNGEKVKEMLTGWGERFKFLQGPINLVKAGIDGLMNAWMVVKRFILGDEAVDKQIAEKAEKLRNEQANKDTEYEVKRLESIGASEEEIYNAKKKALEEKILLMDKESDEYKDAVLEQNSLERDHTKYVNDQNQKQYDEWKKKQDEKLAKDKEYKQMLVDQEAGFQEELQKTIDEYKNKQDELPEEFNPEDSPEIQQAEAINKKKQKLNNLWSATYMEALGLLTEQEQEEYDKQADAYQTLLDTKQISQEQFNAYMLQLQGKYYGELTKKQQNYIMWANMTDEQRKEFVIDNLAGIFGAAAALFEEQTVAYKAFASAQIIMDAASAIMKTWSAYSGIPVAGPILAGLQTAVITATAAVQLAKIAGVKFAGGGILNGPSHANGGILTPYGEVEGGEAVINKASMTNPDLRNLASAVNVAGGGRSFATGDASVSLSSSSIAMIVSGISAGVNNKKVYVVESDITETQNKVAVTEQTAIL